MFITVLRVRNLGRVDLFNLLVWLILPVGNTMLLVDHTFFSPAFVVVNLDIVRTEGNNDTPDVELTEMDLLLTPTVVFGFSLNDKIWRTFF